MPKAQSKSSQSEEVRKIPVAEIHPFEGHPFRVVDDELMQQTVDSIMQFGVLSPAIVRPDPNGGYEMVSGHRRLHACGLAGLEEIPAIVRNLTDDEAVILMVDSNLQRETILPSERAAAYKMKLEALKHQGKRKDIGDEATSPQVGEKSSWAVSLVANDVGESRSQVQRYVRLNELLPEIREKVDTKEIAFSPAVELSYLKPAEQKQFLDAMDYSQATPSLSQAQRLKKPEMAPLSPALLPDWSRTTAVRKRQDSTWITVRMILGILMISSFLSAPRGAVGRKGRKMPHQTCLL